jgi:hypothetical protein
MAYILTSEGEFHEGILLTNEEMQIADDLRVVLTDKCLSYISKMDQSVIINTLLSKYSLTKRVPMAPPCTET